MGGKRGKKGKQTKPNQSRPNQGKQQPGKQQQNKKAKNALYSSGFQSVPGAEAPADGWKFLALCKSILEHTRTNLEVLKKPVSLRQEPDFLDDFDVSSITQMVKEISELHSSGRDVFAGMEKKPNMPRFLPFLINYDEDEAVKDPKYLEKLTFLKEIFAGNVDMTNAKTRAKVKQHVVFMFEEVQKAVLAFKEAVAKSRGKMVEGANLVAKTAKSSHVEMQPGEAQEAYFRRVGAASYTSDEPCLESKEIREHVVPLMVQAFLEEGGGEGLAPEVIAMRIAERVKCAKSLRSFVEPTVEMREYIRRGRALFKKGREAPQAPAAAATPAPPPPVVPETAARAEPRRSRARLAFGTDLVSMHEM